MMTIKLYFYNENLLDKAEEVKLLMLMNELLKEYEKRIYKNKRHLSELNNNEKMLGGLFLLCLICYSVLTFIFWKNNKALLIIVSITVLIMCLLMCLGNRIDNKNAEEKIKGFRINHIEELKKILKRQDHYYYSIRQIDVIIDWCDRKAEEENNVLDFFRPLTTFVAIILIPVSILVLDKSSGSEYSNSFVSSVVIYVFFCMLIATICAGIGPHVRDFLNRKKQVVKKLADDLRNLKLSEPYIPDTLSHKP